MGLQPFGRCASVEQFEIICATITDQPEFEVIFAVVEELLFTKMAFDGERWQCDCACMMVARRATTLAGRQTFHKDIIVVYKTA